MAKEDNVLKQLDILNKVSEYIKNHGVIATIRDIFMTLIICWGFYIAFNPKHYIEKIFDTYTQYLDENHNASTEFRIQSAPILRSLLNQLSLETNAERVFIFEYHNGKNNPSGQQWQYGDMTFINDNTYDISDEYQNVPLIKYNIGDKIYKDGFYSGTIEEVSELDPKLAARLISNDTKKIFAVSIYGEDSIEIGFLGLSFVENEQNLTDAEIIKILHKYVAQISPYLDWKLEKKKRKK